MRDLPARDDEFDGWSLPTPSSEAYDFSGIERLADVGGGHGLLLASILRRYPEHCRACCSTAPRWWPACPRASSPDARAASAFEAGSFFERVPDGCDAYMMKHIIHDWSDEHCRTILRLMRDKLPKNGRVLICEMVVADEPGPTPAKMLDIEMLVMTVGGKERTAEEFGDLFAASGLRLNRIVPTAARSA